MLYTQDTHTVWVGDAHAHGAALMQWQRLGDAVHGSRRREHELAASILHLHALEKVKRGLDVVSVNAAHREQSHPVRCR